MSTLYVDTINEQTTGNGIYIPGHVLQVKNTFLTTNINTSSTSFVTTGLSLSITPGSTSSKVLAIVNIGAWYVTATSNSSYATIYRDATNIGDGNNGIMRVLNQAEYTPSTGLVLDSPASTSALTYEVYFRVTAGASYISYPGYGHFGITLMEIGG